jgi:hypothetical protein
MNAIDKAKARYAAAMHGVQSAIAYEISAKKNEAHSPKHLRTGVNSAMVNAEAIATLLITKGIITELEYVEALADAAERELARYEERNKPLKFK